MVSKKVTNKNQPSIIRSSAAEYLTFIAASGGGVEESSVIRNFRITANLQDVDKATDEIAKVHAESDFEKYRIIQDRVFESDFDREVKKMLEGRSEKFGGGDE
jgi:hypothetical protein